MRKLFNLFAAALVVLAAVSCEKSEVLPDSTKGKVVTLSATIDNGGTKTSLGEQGSDGVYPVYWSAGDKIAVIQGTNVYEFTLVGNSSTSTSGTFTSSNAEGFDPNQGYKAFYPYSAVFKESTSIKYSIPSTQEYAPKSFGPGAMPMVATVNSGTTMTFNNLFGVVKIVVDGDVGETISSIEFGSTIPLCGRGVFDGDFFTINYLGASYSSNITLNCNNTNIENSTEFLIAIPTIKQQVYSEVQQIAIVLHTNKGSYYKSVSGDMTGDKAIKVGNILKMPTIRLTDPENPNARENMKIAYESNGNGTLIGKTVWAPVNCGYTQDGKYGLFYSHSDLQENPCPSGWRVPTREEFLSLNSLQITWTTPADGNHAGTKGNKFYDNSGREIFLPAAGIMDYETHSLSNSYGYYWTQDGKTAYFSSSSEKLIGGSLTDMNRYSLSVRCVKE